ncbi:MAG: ribose 5-phosphate isomerase [Actinomycetota bacterium]|nr:ribose 5-phosphate isomerase [Actinomycetota bacterium]
MTDQHDQKLAVAIAAAGVVEQGMTVGLGTGSTVELLLPALAGRGLSIRCVATSPRTEEAARALGIAIESFEGIDRLDIAIDGADQVAPDGWLVKGGGGAHTREKLIEAAADRFVVIADGSKLVEAIGPPIPLEVMAFGVASVLRVLAPSAVRGVPHSPDGGIIADYNGAVEDPAALAARFDGTPGLIEHGLFPPSMVDEILIGHADGTVERRSVSGD